MKLSKGDMILYDEGKHSHNRYKYCRIILNNKNKNAMGSYQRQSTLTIYDKQVMIVELLFRNKQEIIDSHCIILEYKKDD